MSRSSSSSMPKISNQYSSKSAWSKGPPQNATAPSRPQSPAPDAQTQSSHSRRPRTLGQGLPFEDGVSIPRNNVGAMKQGSAVTFGSIDDVSAPISSTSASAPPSKSKGAKSSGSVATPAIPKTVIHTLFQDPSSQPSTPSTSYDTSSPTTRQSPLPSQSSSNQSNQQPPLFSTPFVANSCLPSGMPPIPGQTQFSRTPRSWSELCRYKSMPSQMPPYYSPFGPHSSGVSMSPPIHTPHLQGPGTSTISHAVSTSQASSSKSSVSSPPPLPSNAPPGRAKITLKKPDGTEVDLETLVKANPVRIETPEKRRKRIEEEQQKKKQRAEAKEKAKKEKERKKKERKMERKKKEEEERVRKEEEKKELLRKDKEEEDWIRKVEEEIARDKERERQKKEETERERQRKEQEERERQRKEEEQREKERVEEEQRKRKEEEERRVAEEEEKHRKEEEQERARKQAREEAKTATEVPVEGESNPEEPKVTEGRFEGGDSKDRSRESLRINTVSSVSEKRRPGPLDLTHSRQHSSSLTLARPLKDLGSVTYPEGIVGPKPELNAGGKEGRFRYDRDFLLQFMPICEGKPESLPPLEALGLEPVSSTRGGSGRTRQLPGTSAPSRQASTMGGAGLRGQFQSMGQFAISSGKFGPGSERFDATGMHSVSMGVATMPFRGTPQWTASQGVLDGAMPGNRTRTKRGKKKSDTTPNPKDIALSQRLSELYACLYGAETRLRNEADLVRKYIHSLEGIIDDVASVEGIDDLEVVDEDCSTGAELQA